MNIDKLVESLTEDEKEELITKLNKPAVEKEPAFPMPNGEYFVMYRDDSKGFITTPASQQRDEITPAFTFENKILADKVCEYINGNFWFIRKAIEYSLLGIRGAKDTFICYDTHRKSWDIYKTSEDTPTDVMMSSTSAKDFVKWLEEYAPEGVLLDEY